MEKKLTLVGEKNNTQVSNKGQFQVTILYTVFFIFQISTTKSEIYVQKYTN